jgi:hypothetical protein
MAEADGVPYHIRDPQAEILAMMLFAQYAELDGEQLANWIDAPANIREFYRQMARGEVPLIRL